MRAYNITGTLRRKYSVDTPRKKKLLLNRRLGHFVREEVNLNSVCNSRLSPDRRYYVLYASMHCVRLPTYAHIRTVYTLSARARACVRVCVCCMRVPARVKEREEHHVRSLRRRPVDWLRTARYSNDDCRAAVLASISSGFVGPRRSAARAHERMSARRAYACVGAEIAAGRGSLCRVYTRFMWLSLPTHYRRAATTRTERIQKRALRQRTVVPPTAFCRSSFVRFLPTRLATADGGMHCVVTRSGRANGAIRLRRACIRDATGSYAST